MTTLLIDYHCVFTFAGVFIEVDGDTRKEIEAWQRLEDDDTRRHALTIETIHGEEATLYRGCIAAILESSSESRRRYRDHSKLIQDEVPVEER
jgi:hypothetical protein